MIRIIVAIDSHYLIGNGDKLPWHCPEDLQRFKRMTTGNTVVMGRKTFDSLKRRPLPDRKNIVLTSEKWLWSDNALYFSNSIDEILNMKIEGDLYVIGGAQIYEQFLPYSDFIHLTILDKRYEGDTFLPFTIDDIEKDFKVNNIEYFEDFMCINYERKRMPYVEKY